MTIPEPTTLGSRREQERRGDERLWPKNWMTKKISDVFAQVISKCFRSRRSTIVIRLKSGVQLSTNEPFDERVFYNIDQQFVNFRAFVLFHSNKVIGLHGKYNNKNLKCKKNNNSNEICECYYTCSSGHYDSFPFLRNQRHFLSNHNESLTRSLLSCWRIRPPK